MTGFEVKKIRELKGISQSEMSVKMGVSLRTIQNWEGGKVIPETKHAMLRNLLIDSNINPGSFEKVIENKGIPLLPFDAFAGLGDIETPGVAFDIIEERYIIPLFNGMKVDFMIPVRGSSMYPKYSSGDVVACRLINELLFVQWNKVYIIDTSSQGVIMKRLLKGSTDDHVICKSDNTDYPPFSVPMTDIRSIALVVGVIRLE